MRKYTANGVDIFLCVCDWRYPNRSSLVRVVKAWDQGQGTSSAMCMELDSHVIFESTFTPIMKMAIDGVQHARHKHDK